MAARATQRLQALLDDLDAETHRGESPAAAPGAGNEDAASSLSLGGLSDLAPGASLGSSHGGAAFTRTSLETKVLALLAERRALEATHAQQLAAADAAAAAAAAAAKAQLAELAHRMREVEARAPLLTVQLADARAALSGDLAISEERATALRARDPDSLSLDDAARLAVHDALHELRAENERLRLAGDSAREGLARHEAEVARLRRDNARLAAGAAERDAGAEAALAAIEARASRLADELQEAQVAAEVLRAKGRAYDELDARAERLEAEVARLGGAEAAARQLEGSVRGAEAAAAALEAKTALLEEQRAAAARRAQAAEEQVAELEAALGARDEKIADLKRTRAELYQKLGEAAGKQDDGRMEREVARLQAAAATDLERVRREAVGAAEREARLLRDMRDAAQDEAARLRSELHELQAVQDDALAAARDARARCEAQAAELGAVLAAKSADTVRLQALCDERASELQGARERIQLLEDKVRLLTGAATALEADAARSGAELDAAVAQLAAYEAAEAVLGGGGGGEGLAGALLGGVGELGGGCDGGGREARPLRAAGLRAMHARLSALEAEVADAQRAARGAAESARDAEAARAHAERMLGAASAPQRYVLEQLSAAEARAEAAEARGAELQAALDARGAEHAALRGDLQRLLRERGALDSLRALVAGALTTKAPRA